MYSSREYPRLVNEQYETDRARARVLESGENLTSSEKECVYSTVGLITVAVATVAIVSSINPIAGGVVAGLIVLGVIGWAVWRAWKK